MAKGKKKTVGSVRAKAGLSAKAGRRSLGRKRPAAKVYGSGYVMSHDVLRRAVVPVGAVLVQGLNVIRNRQLTEKGGSDLFKWDRLRAHWRNGLVDLKDLLTA